MKFLFAFLATSLIASSSWAMRCNCFGQLPNGRWVPIQVVLGYNIEDAAYNCAVAVTNRAQMQGIYFIGHYVNACTY